MRRVVVLSLAAGLLFSVPAMAEPPAAQSSVYGALNLFDQAFERVRRDAVEKTTSRHLVRTAIDGMLASIDPNAMYFDKAALALMSGEKDTLGLVVTARHGTVRVIAPRDGSPAAAAGIRAGDIILMIGREPAAIMSLREVDKRLEGPPGSKLTLRIERHGVDHPIKLVVTRAIFHPQTVRSRLLGHLGYIRLAGFEKGTPAALSEAIKGLRKKSGNTLKGIILDLRNNPGGQFSVAVKVADSFLTKGVIAEIARPHTPPKPIHATPGDLAEGLPMVALINEGTAQGAELVAAALRDNHRAVLVGTKSFGDNAVESMIPLKNGGAIRLATTRFLTPRGRRIAGKGIRPEITVKPVKLVKLAQGLRIREADLPGALKNPNPRNAKGAPAVAGPETGLASPKDEQLLRAADILRALAIIKSANAS